jgi:large subunit ribosomal protein L9
MKVIFLKDVENVADADTVKVVSDGYARNFLFPKKLAISVTESALKSLEVKQQARKEKEEQDKAALKELAAKLNGVEIEITTDVGENGKLFGSVTTADISKKIHEVTGLEVDKKKIHLDEPIKATGKYKVPVKYASDISATINLNVAATSK